MVAVHKEGLDPKVIHLGKPLAFLSLSKHPGWFEVVCGQDVVL